ncbi:hypothetical protein OF846_004353 [Rhodotorula toruloides]|nr:hypothetical protein OF846_004353 [Rhodotorula toruloides]
MGQLPEDVMKRETGCASHSRSGNGRDGLGRACKGAEVGRTDCVRLLPSFSTFRATVSAAPDLREPASPGGSGYTVNTSSTAHHLPAHEFVSSAKHATDAVKEQTPQGKAGKTGDEK